MPVKPNLLEQFAFFTAVTGPQSPLAVVLSTLIIIALINPLRRRIQVAIGPRFYRCRYDIARVLTSFANLMRDGVDRARIAEALHGSVIETLPPEGISI